jgi:mRNA interferase MazF
MVDKLTAISRSKLGEHVGHLDADTMLLLDEALLLFLGLATLVRGTRDR